MYLIISENGTKKKHHTGEISDTYIFDKVKRQGSHKNVKNKFPDFSLTSNEISLTILSTTDCRAISYVNISDESRCLK